MIVVETVGGGFDLSFKGKLVLRHREKRPVLGLGRGECRISMTHGMYRLRDQRLHAWTEAGEWRLEAVEPERVLISFPGLCGLEGRVEGGRLLLRVSPAAGAEGAGPANRLSLRLELDPAEPVHGCGEQFSHAELRGKRFPLWVSEPGVGRGPNYVRLLAELHSGRGGSPTHSYFPQPSFLTGDGLSCLADWSGYAVFDFRRPGRAELAFHGIPASVSVGAGEDAAAALGDLSHLLGRQPSLPDWAREGMWLGLQGGRAVVEASLDKALAAGIKVGALWCQDWQGIRMTPYGKQLFWNWKYDEELYPDLPGFIRELHARGIRFLGYDNPFLAADAPQFAEAERLGYLVRDAAGATALMTTTTFPVGLLDLSNPAARTWFKGIVKRNMLGIGMDGWMADFGEYLPPEAALHSAEDAMLAHNRYPVEWARVNREAVEEAQAEAAATAPASTAAGPAAAPADIVFFCRSGFTGSTREVPLFWAGDQLVDFRHHAGLPAVLAAGISAGMSGVGNWHFDIGGFLSLAWIRRTRELLFRSAELAAFTQVMRSHEGINPGVNAQFDDDAESLAHFARMTRVHATLGPYHRHLAAEYAAWGLPPLRPPSLHYGAAAAERGRPSAYLYGRDLFVAPVLRPGRRSRRLSLPADEWIHLWSGRAYGGGSCRVAAPFGEPPVFYRKASAFAELFRGLAATAAGLAGEPESAR
jgi:alpha-glucosidase